MNRKQVLITLFAMAIFAVYAVVGLSTGHPDLASPPSAIGTGQVDALYNVAIVILIPVLFLGYAACAVLVKVLFP